MEKQFGFITGITKLALNAFIKAAKADIRTHNEDRIPGGPVVFVVNHFTRMETFFLPYTISKITGTGVLSLAHHSFFKGNFGSYLNRLGAISTADPDRDRIIISALLRGDTPCMIFPEGQMIKDKKIIAHGKYLIDNSGIRRPPHTGAGIAALRSEFYRAKLRYFLETGFTDGIDEYIRHFQLGSRNEIDRIIGLETTIVPVNITYFPIRARTNIVNKIASLFVEHLPERIKEEIEVEGAMIVDGTDIDINFGEPIRVRPYLDKRSIKKMVRNSRTGLAAGDITAGTLRFRREGVALMHRYMDRIYGMTTVNHDHVFAYILGRCIKNKISEAELRARAYCAIDRIQTLSMQSCHSSLLLKQNYLLTDDPHGWYESFKDAAKYDGLVYEKDGYLVKNTERFSRPYTFHTIRRDNIIEVLKNEIEPLGNVVHAIERVMRLPSFFVRRTLRNRFLRLDRDIFLRDYEKYYIEGESKPRTIGQPFFLRRFCNRRGVLLIHGYMSAPEEIRKLAEHLHCAGYAVYGVRMRGHGTAPEDLGSRYWSEWYESANRGYIVLKNTVRDMAVVGFSTGAGMALYQAITKRNQFKCAVSINAPLKVNNIGSKLASTIVMWNTLLEKLRVGRGKMEFVANNPENPHINYLRNPVHGVSELDKFMSAVEKRLNEISIPTLIIQGSNDPVVNPKSGYEIFDLVGSKNRELCRVFAERHGIVNGEGSENIFRHVRRFVDDAMGGRA